MGFASGASIWFGIDLGAEEELEETSPLYVDGEHEFDGLGEFLAACEGLNSPYDEAPDYDPEFSEYKAAHPDFDQRADAYRARVKQLEEESPVDLVKFGHYDYGHYGLALKGSYRRIYGWDAEILTTNPDQEGSLGDVKRAQEFCSTHGFPEFEPRWMIGLSYG